VGAVLLVLVVWLGVPGAAAAQSLSPETLRDYDVVNGYFFTQTGASAAADQGFTITDEGGIALWTEFQRLGGVDALGYPVSRRFVWDGFVVQATQKVVLQWRPDLGRAVYVNLLDEMSRANKDDWLLSYRMIPRPAAFADEAGLSFDEIVEHRLRLLDAYPALRAAYLLGDDPVTTNGLPVAPVADMGPAYVLRAQRRAFQLWKVATPFARPGDVTVVNGGDLGKEAELYPATVVRPEPASAQIATPPGSETRLGAEAYAALRQIVERVRPAVVQLTDRETGLGSGIIIDASGLILTNSHVVTSLTPEKLVAILSDGRVVRARPLGADDWTDVAVVKIEAPDLPAVPLGNARALAVGERVLGIGYSPLFPAPPSAKTGIVRSLAGEIQTFHDYPLFDLITSNTYLYPGDSGGPLLNMAGQVVGINSAIRPPRGRQELLGFSIPLDGAMQVAQQIIASGQVPRPQMGVTIADVTPNVASNLGLPVNRGVLVRQVQAGSPAALAGVQPNDVIVAIDSTPVPGVDDLYRLMVAHKVGDTVSVSLVGASGQRRTANVTLVERPPLV
jgi:S1-C subfamily serine protease